jgi:MFS family permease
VITGKHDDVAAQNRIEPRPADQRRQQLQPVPLLAAVPAASALAAFSANAVELIVYRGFMGAGAALITPATLAVVTHQTAPARRARAIAIWASSGALAVAIGPVAGGALLTQFWWGSVFLLNLPVAALCLAGAGTLMPELRYPGRRVLDPLGTVLSMLGLGFLVYGVIQGGGQSGLSSPLTLAPLLIGLLLLTVFVMVQPRWTAHHRGTFGIDTSIFKEPRFSGGSVALLLLFFGLAGPALLRCFLPAGGARAVAIRGGSRDDGRRGRHPRRQSARTSGFPAADRPLVRGRRDPGLEHHLRQLRVL